MGKLYPCCIMEAVPGDKFSISCESLIRLAPLVSPLMHRIDAYFHYFFVPNRLVWNNWEKFIVGQQSPGGSVPAYPFINITNGQDGVKSLSDYLGIGVPNGATVLDVSAIPYAAYQKVYDEYYRDQNLINPAVSGTGANSDWSLLDGDNTAFATELKAIRRRAWEHDYFTACLPFAQKGDPVNIPLGLQDAAIRVDNGGSGYADWNVNNGGGSPNVFVENQPLNTSPDVPNDVLYANTSGVQSTTTINDLRRAFKLQEWLEKNARGGSRYIEHILAHFGVRSSDKRLQRPEYITGVRTPITISEVLNTTGDPLGLPQGNMAGHGVGTVSGKYGSYFCEEHGYVIGVMSVMPKTAYMQGLPRHFSKREPLDYYYPSFAHLGEQEVLNKELYLDHTDPDGTFGYLPRYAEYKFMNSRVAGDFKGSLDYWTMARKFTSNPALNKTFIESNPTRDVFAITDPTEDLIYAHVLNRIKAVRKMPFYGSPSF